jgi:uncharacterized protein YaiL (DUF2058 family)
MTKNKDIYNVSFSGSPVYQSTTTAPSKKETNEEDLFMQAVKQQHEAVLESEKQYKEKQKKNRENYEQGIKTFPDSVVTAVRHEMLERAKQGFIKYNETLDRTDLSVIDYLQHAKEEAMDLALYLEKTIQMLKGNK